MPEEVSDTVPALSRPASSAAVPVPPYETVPVDSLSMLGLGLAALSLLVIWLSVPRLSVPAFSSTEEEPLVSKMTSAFEPIAMVPSFTRVSELSIASS